MITSNLALVCHSPVTLLVPSSELICVAESSRYVQEMGTWKQSISAIFLITEHNNNIFLVRWRILVDATLVESNGMQLFSLLDSFMFQILQRHNGSLCRLIFQPSTRSAKDLSPMTPPPTLPHTLKYIYYGKQNAMFSRSRLTSRSSGPFCRQVSC